jgi:hypothetical protein
MEEEIKQSVETPTVEKSVDEVDKKGEEPIEPNKEGEPSDPLLSGHYLTNPFFHELANYFGIEEGDFDATKDKLSVIADWAYTESKSKQPEDILLAIRHLEDKIQPAEWGERRYANVYKYIRLASRKQALEKAMSAFEKENK